MVLTIAYFLLGFKAFPFRLINLCEKFMYWSDNSIRSHYDLNAAPRNITECNSFDDSKLHQ